MILPSWFWAMSAVVTSAATPVLAVLNSGAPITFRSVAAMAIGAVVASLIAFKSYYSTKYSDEQAATLPKKS